MKIKLIILTFLISLFISISGTSQETPNVWTDEDIADAMKKGITIVTEEEFEGNDPRLVIDRKDERFVALTSIVKIEVPVRVTLENGKRVDTSYSCSGTVVSFIPGTQSNVVFTARHCFDGWDANPVTIRIYDHKGELHFYKDKGVYFGKNVENDGAIIILDRTPALDVAIPVLVPCTATSEQLINTGNNYIVGGYSGDRLRGKYGSELTVTFMRDLSKAKSSPNFSIEYLLHELPGVIYRGASGGLIAFQHEPGNNVYNPYSQLIYYGNIKALGMFSTYYILNDNRHLNGSSTVHYTTLEEMREVSNSISPDYVSNQCSKIPSA